MTIHCVANGYEEPQARALIPAYQECALCELRVTLDRVSLITSGENGRLIHWAIDDATKIGEHAFAPQHRRSASRYGRQTSPLMSVIEVKVAGSFRKEILLSANGKLLSVLEVLSCRHSISGLAQKNVDVVTGFGPEDQLMTLTSDGSLHVVKLDTREVIRQHVPSFRELVGTIDRKGWERRMARSASLEGLPGSETSPGKKKKLKSSASAVNLEGERRKRQRASNVACWRPCGEYVFLGWSDGAIEILDRDSFQRRAVLQTAEVVNPATCIVGIGAWLGNGGKSLVSATAEGAVSLWRWNGTADGGRLICSKQGHSGSVVSGEFLLFSVGCCRFLSTYVLLFSRLLPPLPETKSLLCRQSSGRRQQQQR